MVSNHSANPIFFNKKQKTGLHMCIIPNKKARSRRVYFKNNLKELIEKEIMTKQRNQTIVMASEELDSKLQKTIINFLEIIKA